MTSQEILQMSLIDDKEINKHRRKLSLAYASKRAAWKALWPFAYMTHSDIDFVNYIAFIVGVVRIIIYVMLALVLAELTDSLGIGLVIFAVLYILQFSLWMFFSKKAIKKEMDALAEYEQKYKNIRNDYYKEEIERNAIERVNGGFQHVGKNGLITLLREDRIYLYGQLDDSYGNILIYPQNNEVAPTKQEMKIDFPSVNKKIASVKFNKLYTVYTDLDNTNRCFTYLTPTILQSYVNGADCSRDVLVYTIREEQMEVSFKGEVPDPGVNRLISFISYDNTDNLHDPFCKFKAKVSTYDRYFADMTEWITEIAKERDYRFLFKEEV